MKFSEMMSRNQYGMPQPMMPQPFIRPIQPVQQQPASVPQSNPNEAKPTTTTTQAGSPNTTTTTTATTQKMKFSEMMSKGYGGITPTPVTPGMVPGQVNGNKQNAPLPQRPIAPQATGAYPSYVRFGTPVYAQQHYAGQQFSYAYQQLQPGSGMPAAYNNNPSNTSTAASGAPVPSSQAPQQQQQQQHQNINETPKDVPKAEVKKEAASGTPVASSQLPQQQQQQRQTINETPKEVPKTEVHKEVENPVVNTVIPPVEKTTKNGMPVPVSEDALDELLAEVEVPTHAEVPPPQPTAAVGVLPESVGSLDAVSKATPAAAPATPITPTILTQVKHS